MEFVTSVVAIAVGVFVGTIVTDIVMAVYVVFRQKRARQQQLDGVESFIAQLREAEAAAAAVDVPEATDEPEK